MDRSSKIISLLGFADAYRNHGVLPDGQHTNNFIIASNLYPHLSIVSQVAREMAELFEVNSIEVVIAPTPDEIILAQWVAFHLTELDINRGKVLVIPMKMKKGDFVLRPNHKELLKFSNRALVVRNILFNGDSTEKVIKYVKNSVVGRNLIGLGAIVNYGIGYSESFVPVQHSLINAHTCHVSDCQVCALEFWRRHLAKEKHSS